MKALLIFVALFTFAHAGLFTVTLQLSSKPFSVVHNAALRMWLALPGVGGATYFLVGKGDMAPSKNFTTEVDISFDPTKIDRAAFWWMPESMIISKKGVFLDHVMITGSIEREHKPRRDITMKLVPVFADQPIQNIDRTPLRVDYISG